MVLIMILKIEPGGKTRFASSSRFNLIFDRFWGFFRIRLVAGSQFPIQPVGLASPILFLKPWS